MAKDKKEQASVSGSEDNKLASSDDLSASDADTVIENNQEHVRNSVRYWRPEIQRYLHANDVETSADPSKK